MAKSFVVGQMVLLPENFNLRDYRNRWARVESIVNGRLRLRVLGMDEITATFDDVSAKRSLNVNQRWEVLKRDRFCCRLCGRGARPGLGLHVDHARSFDDGGSTEDLSNLWTLCSDCNFGKGAASMGVPALEENAVLLNEEALRADERSKVQDEVDTQIRMELDCNGYEAVPEQSWLWNLNVCLKAWEWAHDEWKSEIERKSALLERVSEVFAVWENEGSLPPHLVGLNEDIVCELENDKRHRVLEAASEGGDK